MGWGTLELGHPITESDLVPTSSTAYIEDLVGLSKIGVDELSDSDADLQQVVVQEFGKKIAYMENTAFIAGAGHGASAPEGITTNTTLLAAAIETAAPAAVTIDDMLNAIYTVPAAYRKGVSIIVHSQTELALRQLKAAVTGTYLWQPSVQANTPNTFAGFPIYSDDNLGTVAGTTEVVAIVGNIAEGYRIYDRQGISIQRLDELYAEEGCVGFKSTYRVGGVCIRPADQRIVLMKEHT
jgi:HK97 family phage major capsid protein